MYWRGRSRRGIAGSAVRARHGCDGMVAGREEGPTREPFLACKPQKFLMKGFSATADRNTPARIAGRCRETLLLLPENPDRNPAPAEAAGQPETAIVTTDHDRTLTGGRIHPCTSRARRSMPRAR